MQNNKEELANCPFCGGRYRDLKGYDIHKVSCSNEHCPVNFLALTKEQWNTRADQQLVNELTELLGAVTQGYSAEEIYHHYGIDSTRAERIVELLNKINNKGGE